MGVILLDFLAGGSAVNWFIFGQKGLKWLALLHNSLSVLDKIHGIPHLLMVSNF